MHDLAARRALLTVLATMSVVPGVRFAACGFNASRMLVSTFEQPVVNQRLRLHWRITGRFTGSVNLPVILQCRLASRPSVGVPETLAAEKYTCG
mgnify:CR=1 FL=1